MSGRDDDGFRCHGGGGRWVGWVGWCFLGRGGVVDSRVGDVGKGGWVGGG